MLEVRPKKIKLIISIAYTAVGGLITLMIASFYLHIGVSVVIGAIITAGLYYMMVMSSNIRLSVDHDHLYVYRGNTLRKTYLRSECVFSAKLTEKKGKTDYILKIEIEVDGKKQLERVDCSQLAIQDFYDLLNALNVVRHQ